ncbi:MAG: MarR family transcriptional regulator [Devosia sp.]|uniref:MarR family winged helix-turn-helix transcriptional regulator n=1 Tax=Devosia sp. TaxID=1871048 RepID=UPI0024CC649B|nr:MarR family transcriptional regulator [Devosia sp.]UYO01117.1 MAG: MarR family transcriptional regulator [Devosia sp.]
MRRDVLGTLMMVTKLMNADMERGLGPAGLTMARAQVLWEIGGAPGMTQKMLADRLGVTPRNVTGLVDALEGLGLVERKAHPQDRRAIQLFLTASGAGQFRQFQAGQEQFATLLLGDVSPERLAGLRTELHAIVGKLSALAEGDQTGR